MQDIDRPTHVQALSEPARRCRPRVKVEPQRVVPRAEDIDGISGDGGRRRDCGQQPAVRPPEAELAVGLSIHLVTLFVDRAVVPPTEHGEIRERGRAAVRPVADVMPLAEREPAAREAAASVAVVKHAP
jgi:hypothetical protein